MFPISSLDYEFNSGSRDIVFDRKLSGGRKRFVVLSNFKNNFLCKFSTSLFRTLSFVLSLLFDHIQHIFFLCTEEQMAGVNTTGIVAAMANAKTLWDFSFVKFIGKPVSSVDSKRAISILIFSSRPFPTLVKRDHLSHFPKAIFHGRHAVPITPNIRGIK